MSETTPGGAPREMTPPKEVEWFKCRSVGESFNEDDWTAREWLFTQLDTLRAEHAALSDRNKHLAAELTTLARIARRDAEALEQSEAREAAAREEIARLSRERRAAQHSTGTEGRP